MFFVGKQSKTNLFLTVFTFAIGILIGRQVAFTFFGSGGLFSTNNNNSSSFQSIRSEEYVKREEPKFYSEIDVGAIVKYQENNPDISDLQTEIRSKFLPVPMSGGILPGNVSVQNGSTFTNKVRVLCWVLTSPKTHESRAIHVKNTWGRRCDTLLFMSTKADATLESIALPVKEGRGFLWGKTAEAFKFIYKHHLNDADWFLKADDDTFVILENLKSFISSYDSNEAVHFGFKFKPYVKQGYMSGGAGYVLSKMAMDMLGQNLFGNGSNSSECRVKDSPVEDLQLGRCLEQIGVRAGDSRDSSGLHRFTTFFPDFYMNPGNLKALAWFQKYTFYPQQEGLNCCSNTTISFHYVTGPQMYVLEYLVYYLKSLNHY